MAHGSSSIPHYEPYHDDSDGEVDAEASSSRSAGRDSDVEHGILSNEAQGSRWPYLQEGLDRLFSNRSSSGARSPSRDSEERHR
jgi:hypothetical protein